MELWVADGAEIGNFLLVLWIFAHQLALMRRQQKFAIFLTALILLMVFRFVWPWENLMEQWRKSQAPTPFRFESLKNLSDEQIASFMAGAPQADSHHPPDAPDSHFADSLWNADPKAAALAFAEANRRPEHRKNFRLTMDASPSLKAPDAGWLVFDPGSASCPLSSSGSFHLIALRFGIDQSFLFRTTTLAPPGWSYNCYVDRSSYSQQLILLSADEARFIAHSVFWLEHVQSEDVRNRKRRITSHTYSRMHSTADSFGQLDWLIPKNPPRRITETLWFTDSIAARWEGEYDPEVSLNLASYLLFEALPKHLGKRWQIKAPDTRAARNLPLTERLKSHADDVTMENLSRVILSALTRHEADPWPADALVSLAECAGESGLTGTLPALENVMAGLPPTSADEAELSLLNTRFCDRYEAPTDPDECKQWDRYKSLQQTLEYDVPTQVRPSLARAIQQIQTMGAIATLSELAKGKDDTAMWALHRLYQLQSDAYLEALCARFPLENQWGRGQIFNVLAELSPAAARRLRDSFTPTELADIFFDVTRFEIGDDPQGARIHIPALFDLAEKPTAPKPAEQKYPERPSRGPAIELLSKLPLNSSEQQRFERLLLKELLTPEHDEIFGNSIISAATTACATLPDPDRFWDALFQAASVETGSSEFHTLIDALASLAVAKPNPHLTQVTELLRPKIAGHKGYMDRLCMVALALDLRALAPEIRHFATRDPTVPDGQNPSPCKDSPCFHRYHSARHVTALWEEPDANTRARMWAAMLLESPYHFVGAETIPTSLRDHCRCAIVQATPEIRTRLVAMIRANHEFPDTLTQWLDAIPLSSER